MLNNARSVFFMEILSSRVADDGIQHPRPAPPDVVYSFLSFPVSSLARSR
jgi:hypothetical protein